MLQFPLKTLFVAACALLACDRGFGQDFSLKDTPGDHLDILQQGKILARYMYAHDVSSPERRLATYKPYLHVFDPAGLQPITKGAGGSFTHHRGIFIGWNKIGVNGAVFDRWHMKAGDQVHEKFIAQSADKESASFTSLVHWQGEKPETSIIDEERTLTFWPAPTPAYGLIDQVSKLKAVAGGVELNGDPEHSGLHFRPADTVAREKTTYLYPKENALPHKDRDYPWFAESYTIGEHSYSVVYLNHPSNPRGGAISAYRDYGRLGVFWKAEIPDGETREFRARFLIVAGAIPSAEIIQKAWNDYAGASDPVPVTTTKPAEYGSSPDSKKATPTPGSPAAGTPPATPGTPKPASPTPQQKPS